MGETYTGVIGIRENTEYVYTCCGEHSSPLLGLVQRRLVVTGARDMVTSGLHVEHG